MTTHIQQRKYAISRIPQTNFQTRTVPSAAGSKSHVKVVATDRNLAQYGVETANNKGHATGVDWATETWATAHGVSVQKSVEVCAEEIGRWLLLAFGSVTTDQPDAEDAPTVYRHKFVPQDADVSRQLPATTYVEQLSSAHDVEYPSQVVESLTLRGDGKGRLTCDVSLMGSGERNNPSGVAFSGGSVHVAVPADLHYFYNSQMALTVDDGDTPIDYLCRYNSFTVSLTNALLAEEGYRPGCALFQVAGDPESGMIRGELLFGERTLSGQFVVRLAAGGAEYAALQEQKDLDITIIATGGTIEDDFQDQLTIRMALSRYQAVSLGESNGIVTLQITVDPLYNQATGKVIEVELINRIASYTA